MLTLPNLSWDNVPAQMLTQAGQLHDDWDRLNTDRSDLPFLTADAMAAALQIFGNGKERLLVGQLDGRNCAMFLLTSVGKLQWQTFQPSQLPLGARVAESGLDLDQMAESLLHGPLKLGLSLSVTQVDPAYALHGDDTSSNRYDDYIDTAWVDILGSFDDYWAARGKNLRQNMRKLRNKLQNESVVLAMRVTRDASEIPSAIARYGELEKSSWKSQLGTAITPDNDQGRFYNRLLVEAAENGEGAVFEYLFDDKVVASNLCLYRAGTLIILKTTYDESIQGYSPAFLLNQDMIQSLFEQQNIKRLEYYGRVMEWHTRWTDNRRTLYHLTTFRNGILKRLARARASGEAAPTETPAKSA